MQGATPQQRHSIAEPSAVGQARRDGQRLAAQSALDETLAGRVGIVITELGNNLVRHAGGGELLVQPIATAAGHQIEVIAIDRGPGMADVDRCLQDGFSTGGTPGTGLGAVRRLSTVFDVCSRAGKGTVVLARVGLPAASAVDFGAVSVPVRGETVCGDGWRLAIGETREALVVLDGLGHGPAAAGASHAGIARFEESPFDEPQRLLDDMHRRLAGSRGAAGACARLARGRLGFAGLGNIAGRCIGSGRSQGLPSHNGTLGLLSRRLQQFEYDLPPAALVVMHSDGLSARWDLDEHPGLRHRHPGVIAAVLFRDHGRARDDATVVVVRRG